MRKPMKINESNLADVPGDCSDLLVFSVIPSSYIEQRGDIEQSYLFHGNSLISVYNSHVAICLCFRLVTEGFCSPLQKFSKCFRDL